MRANEQTDRMLLWWVGAGVRHADVAVRRSTGAMLWQRGLDLAELPLAWARHENAHCADIYIRPARGCATPLVFLDDVDPSLAGRIARKYSALVIRTSAVGGCHVWLSCTRRLHESERKRAQAWLAARTNADPGSTSGEHLGRLAGFKNWKRGGNWVNVLDDSRVLASWQPILADQVPPPPRERAPVRHWVEGADRSDSAREWGWVCGALEAGHDPAAVRARLADRARPRRGRDAERYAQRTVEQALVRIDLKRHNRRAALPVASTTTSR